MVELICMTEGCQFNRIISNLVDIIPHINSQHKLLEIDEFEKHFKEIQVDVNNVERIENIFLHIIDTIKKQLNKLSRLFEDRLTLLTQNVKQHRLYQLKDLTVLESIAKFSQLNQIKQDKKTFENSLLEYTEDYFDDLAVQFDQMSDYFQEYDDLIQGIIKQKGAMISEPVPQRSVTQIQVMNTPIKTQIKQNEDQPFSNGNQQQDGQLRPLRGYKNDQQQQIGHPELVINQLPQSSNQMQSTNKQRENKVKTKKTDRREQGQQSIQQEKQPYIEQTMFSNQLSSMQVNWKKGKSKSVTVQSLQYLITETTFQLNDYSKFKFMLYPRNPQTTVKIGIICLNRWKQNEIGIDQGLSTMITESYVIDKDDYYTLTFNKGNLIFPRNKSQVSITEYNYQLNDNLSFYIELAQTSIRIMTKAQSLDVNINIK